VGNDTLILELMLWDKRMESKWSLMFNEAVWGLSLRLCGSVRVCETAYEGPYRGSSNLSSKTSVADTLVHLGVIVGDHSSVIRVLGFIRVIYRRWFEYRPLKFEVLLFHCYSSACDKVRT